MVFRVDPFGYKIIVGVWQPLADETDVWLKSDERRANQEAMPHHYGLRACTRDKFSKAYKMKGLPGLARYMTVYRRGDLVDIKADPSIP